MSIVFNPDDQGYQGMGERDNKPGGGPVIRLAMKLAGIKDEAVANRALLVVALIFFALSGYILFVYL